MASTLGGFFRRLLGDGDGGDAAGERGPAVEYKGYTISAAPRKQGSQWLTSGVIAKRFGEDVKEHHFIRAETHGGKDSAAEFAILKGKQIVEELGDRVFKDD